MNKSEFIAEVAKIVEADPSSLGESTPLASLAGWDSMATMSFLAMVDSRLGMVVEPARLANCRTVGDLVALVADRLRG